MDGANRTEKKNTGYWVKLRHDRRMAGEGVSCRLLLAGDYERKPGAEGLWGECEHYEGIIMDAASEANRMLTSAQTCLSWGIICDKDKHPFEIGAG